MSDGNNSRAFFYMVEKKNKIYVSSKLLWVSEISVCISLLILNNLQLVKLFLKLDTFNLSKNAMRNITKAKWDHMK